MYPFDRWDDQGPESGRDLWASLCWVLLTTPWPRGTGLQGALCSRAEGLAAWMTIALSHTGVLCFPRLPLFRNGDSERQSANSPQGWRKGLLGHTPVLPCPAQRKAGGFEITGSSLSAHLPSCLL